MTEAEIIAAAWAFLKGLAVGGLVGFALVAAAVYFTKRTLKG